LPSRRLFQFFFVRFCYAPSFYPLPARTDRRSPRSSHNSNLVFVLQKRLYHSWFFSTTLQQAPQFFPRFLLRESRSPHRSETLFRDRLLQLSDRLRRHSAFSYPPQRLLTLRTVTCVRSNRRVLRCCGFLYAATPLKAAASHKCMAFSFPSANPPILPLPPRPPQNFYLNFF